MSPSKATLFAIGVLCMYISSAQTWFLGYEFRKEITLNGADISGTHTDFPILFQLASDSELSSNARSDGYDIVFTDSRLMASLSNEKSPYNLSRLANFSLN